MKRILAFCYGTLCYLLFLATFLYAIAFLCNFGLTRTIDGDGTMPFGQALLINTLVAQARARGWREVSLHAQAPAVDFYLRHGFVPHGGRFQEAGIEHQEMVLPLSPAA